MPNGMSLKRKDIPVLETGRPFSPTMFEGVLKKFTPDVSNSISGRPRFVLNYLIILSPLLRKTKPTFDILSYSQLLDCVLYMH